MDAFGLRGTGRLLVSFVVLFACSELARADPVGTLIVNASRGPLVPGDTVEPGVPVQVSLTASVQNPPPVRSDSFSANSLRYPFWARPLSAHQHLASS